MRHLYYAVQSSAALTGCLETEKRNEAQAVIIIVGIIAIAINTVLLCFSCRAVLLEDSGPDVVPFGLLESGNTRVTEEKNIYYAHSMMPPFGLVRKLLKWRGSRASLDKKTETVILSPSHFWVSIPLWPESCFSNSLSFSLLDSDTDTKESRLLSPWNGITNFY